MKTCIKLFLVLFLIVGNNRSDAQQNLPGHWEGKITIGNMDLGIKVDFKKNYDSLSATIDIPQQNAYNLTLKNVYIRKDTVHFELPAGPGLAVFDGILNGDSITGNFSQSGIQGIFNLFKSTITLIDSVKINERFYNEEEVIIKNGNDTIAGTLTIPKTKGPFAAVILITGSGAQNRDEEIYGFKPFRIIADHLSKNNIAVLRCDDRGVGGSTGKTDSATGKDFMEDVLAQYNYLQSRNEIIKNKIGLLGHSEGATIAVMLAAQKPDVAFIILMAGTGVSGDSIILKQIEVLGKTSGLSDDEIKSSIELQNRVYDVVRSNLGWEELRKTIKKKTIERIEKTPPEQRQGIVDIEKFADMQVETSIRTAKSPWFKFFINYNPAKDLTKVKCPVLGLFGELDMQVDPDINSNYIKNALEKSGSKDYQIHIFPKANHLFQEAKTGSPMEYGALSKEFIPGLLDTISVWISKKVLIE